MPKKKALLKPRNVRQRHARAVRRNLAAISPSNSQAQLQSPLFSVLPAEIRYLIFEHVLSQQHDLSRPIDFTYNPELDRPGHEYHTTVSISLLQTCRLVYYEGRAIPLRSATHHFGQTGSRCCLYTGNFWLHDVTSQRGADMYHLHEVFSTRLSPVFQIESLPHIQWKRITWTLCAYLWEVPRLGYDQVIEDTSRKFSEVVLPSSCREVTLELEAREDTMDCWPALCQEARICAGYALRTSSGEALTFDRDSARVYTWMGRPRCDASVQSREPSRMEHYTIRLCWRANVARREYMSRDRICCLRLSGDIMTSVKSFEDVLG